VRKELFYDVTLQFSETLAGLAARTPCACNSAAGPGAAAQWLLAASLAGASPAASTSTRLDQPQWPADAQRYVATLAAGSL